METSIIDRQILSEERWAAWLEKGKLHDKANARRFKVVAGIVLGVLIASAAYLFIPRP